MTQGSRVDDWEGNSGHWLGFGAADHVLELVVSEGELSRQTSTHGIFNQLVQL